MKGMAKGKTKHLRQLMRSAMAQKKQDKKINSPLVRYNTLGQPVCRVCEVTVKDEALWEAHLASKQHKQTVEALKKQKEAAQNTNSSSSSLAATSVPVFKKPAPPPSVPTFKTPLAPASTKKNELLTKTPNAPQSESLLIGYEEEEEEEEEEGIRAPPPSPASFTKRKAQEMASETTSHSPLPSSSSSPNLPTSAAPQTPSSSSSSSFSQLSPTTKKLKAHPQTEGALPADFFDQSSASNRSVIEAPPSSEVKGALPVGFFDDSKVDAQMRPKSVGQNPSLEDEWETFQATIRKAQEAE